MVNPVNVVGSGSLAMEFDLIQVSAALGTDAAYDPKKYPGMYLRSGKEGPLITLYRTGKYIVTGADSVEDAQRQREQFLNRLADEGIIDAPTEEWFSIQNIVCTGELTEGVNLNAIAIGLGLEDTEYEPEQFPGLIYRPTEFPCVLLLFATGKVVVTGCADKQTAEEAFSHLETEITRLVGTE